MAETQRVAIIAGAAGGNRQGNDAGLCWRPVYASQGSIAIGSRWRCLRRAHVSRERGTPSHHPDRPDERFPRAETLDGIDELLIGRLLFGHGTRVTTK
jgi:hypothetical protein